MILDTSFLVALHHGADRFHRTAKATDLYGDRVLVPWEVWTEFCQVAGLRLASKEGGRLLDRALESPFFVDRLFDMEQVADIARRLRPLADQLGKVGAGPLTLTDAIVCELASKFREGVMTYDRGIQTAIREGLFPGARLG